MRRMGRRTRGYDVDADGKRYYPLPASSYPLPGFDSNELSICGLGHWCVRCGAKTYISTKTGLCLEPPNSCHWGRR